ncbi:MAG: N-methyl-D-aspartate receptor NMDAR2C subunit [Deltaproteobacteria bacterium]|nr:N-methyl-D-aspartate receptor NMDAR2C subunit [Deltaproteobacteria bacterium]
MSADLGTHWEQAFAALGLTKPPGELGRVLAAYAEPQRAYHTGVHLEECLALFDEVRALAQRPAEVALALFYHDVVYAPRRQDNEARSAAQAATALRGAGADPATIARVEAWIMATRDHGETDDADAALVVDIDLAILAAPPARFAAYQEQIRQEYRWVPAWIYRRKRAEVLRHFLAKQPIYRTAALAARFEEPARANLRAALA